VSVTAEPARALGIGIIGAGAVLNRHAAAYLSLPRSARLVAVSDVDRARAERARQLYRMQAAYADHRELLAREDVDVVSVCTRPDTHVRLVSDAVGAGKHVLCEKPIARTLGEADEVIAASERQPGIRVSCLYQWRSDPSVRLARTLLEGNQLGRPLLAEVRLRTWRPDAYYVPEAARESWRLDGGGVLIVVAIHQLDLLLSLLGEASAVSAQMDTFLKPTEGEDTLVGWIRFRSGVLATVRCTVCDQENDFSIDLLGADGAIRLRGGGELNVCRWEVSARDRRKRRELEAIARRVSPRPARGPGPLAVRLLSRWSRVRGRPWLPPAHWWHTPFIRGFLEAVQRGEPAPVPPREARRSLELVTAMYQSALFGSAVRLPLDRSSPLYDGIDAGGSLLAQGGRR
jgi:predicted dehydrogenase